MKSLLVFGIAVFYSCWVFAAPDDNPSASDRVEVIGTIPSDVEAVVIENWQATTDSIFCEHLVGEAGFFADQFSKPSKLISRSDDQRSWVIWRDGVKPGYCGWMLKQVMVYLDSKASGANPVRALNIPTRIAYICRAGERCQNTWASNDDSEQPTYHLCNFKVADDLLSVSKAVNPCPFFFDEKKRGTALGKAENFLRSDQHVIRFVITEKGAGSP